MQVIWADICKGVGKSDLNEGVSGISKMPLTFFRIDFA